MSSTLRISDPCMEQLREASQNQHRTLAGQAEYWIALGQAVERSRLVDFQQIRALANGNLTLEDLDSVEQEFAFDQFLGRMAETSETMENAMESLRRDAEANGKSGL